jgi:hypothetical protein
VGGFGGFGGLGGFGSFGCETFGCETFGSSCCISRCDGASIGVFGGAGLYGSLGGRSGRWASAALATRHPTPVRITHLRHSLMVFLRTRRVYLRSGSPVLHRRLVGGAQHLT